VGIVSAGGHVSAEGRKVGAGEMELLEQAHSATKTMGTGGEVRSASGGTVKQRRNICLLAWEHQSERERIRN